MPGLDQLVNDLMRTGKMSPDLAAAVQSAMANPEQLGRVLDQLKALGAHEIGDGPPLEIGDYYREGPGKYTLRWPLPAFLPLPMSFDELDRKTQFFVLFQEWSRREMEGMMALNAGDADGAERTFQECVGRAEQIEVGELLARAYEDLARVAQKRGDLVAERRWTEQAVAARRS